MPGPRLRPLLAELRRVRPDLDDPQTAVAEGRVLVDGRFVTNPAAQVPVGCSLGVRPPEGLRGAPKLRAALEGFAVAVAGRVALDAGAAAGGFTRTLLDAGAARVYAVDAGHGQLIGSLRQDPRVVNLEGVNLGDLTPALVREDIEVVTLDLSYLALAEAVPQLVARVRIAPGADLVGLVKPMFELHLSSAPTDWAAVDAATEAARGGLEGAGWRVLGVMRSPVAGARGAREALIHARLEVVGQVEEE